MNAETKLAPEHQPTQLAGHSGTPLGGTGVVSPASVHANLTAPQLIAHAIRRNEGRLSADGALIVRTGLHTGRSVADKFVVDEPETSGDVWWGKINQRLDPAHFKTSPIAWKLICRTASCSPRICMPAPTRPTACG